MKYIIFIILLFILVAFTYSISSTIPPFLLSIALSYVLSPLVDVFVEKLKINRTPASLIISVSFFGLIIAVFSLLGPMIYVEFILLINKLTANQGVLMHNILEHIGEISPQAKILIEEKIEDISSQLIGLTTILLQAIVQSTSVAANTLSFLFITPIVTFYILKDLTDAKRLVRSLIPIKHMSEIQKLLNDIQLVMVGFFRGQSIVCAVLAIYYGFSFKLIGIDAWLGLGALFGILIFIPYLGSLIAMMICLIISLSQFGGSYSMIAVVVVLIIGQMLEGMVLTPKFVGRNVGLHPVIIIFSLLAGWRIGGVFAVIMAVPTAAILGVLIRFSLQKYRNSGFYKN